MNAAQSRLHSSLSATRRRLSTYPSHQPLMLTIPERYGGLTPLPRRKLSRIFASSPRSQSSQCPSSCSLSASTGWCTPTPGRCTAGCPRPARRSLSESSSQCRLAAAMPCRSSSKWPRSPSSPCSTKPVPGSDRHSSSPPPRSWSSTAAEAALFPHPWVFASSPPVAVSCTTVYGCH